MKYENGIKIYGIEKKDGLLMRSLQYPDRALWVSQLESAAIEEHVMRVIWDDPYPVVAVIPQINPSWDQSWYGDYHYDTRGVIYKFTTAKFNKFMKKFALRGDNTQYNQPYID